jgi:hypothetical protein
MEIVTRKTTQIAVLFAELMFPEARKQEVNAFCRQMAKQ